MTCLPTRPSNRRETPSSQSNAMKSPGTGTGTLHLVTGWKSRRKYHGYTPEIGVFCKLLGWHRCQAVGALALPLDYIGDVDRGDPLHGQQLISLIPLAQACTLESTLFSSGRRPMVIRYQETGSEMAGQELWGNKCDGFTEWQEGQGDMLLISFLVSHETAAAWQQLKRDKALEDSQLAVFLLQCYEDTTQPSVCPACQSTLEQFCPSCSTSVDNRYKKNNQLTTVAACHHRSGPEHEPDLYTVEPTHTVEPIHSKADHTHPRFKIDHHRQCGKSRRRHSSIYSDIDSSQGHAVDDHEVGDQPKHQKEENEDSADGTVDLDHEEEQLAFTEDVNAADKIEEIGFDASQKKLEASWNNFKAVAENQMTLENGRIPLRSNSVDNVGDVDAVDNKYKIDRKVKTESQTIDSEDSARQSITKTRRFVDIVSCTWCDMTFKTIVALTKHLLTHTTATWQCQHLPCTPYKASTGSRSLKNTNRGRKLRMEVKLSRMTRSQKRVNIESRTHAVEESMEDCPSASGKKIFNCLQCGVSWKTPVGLTYHIQTAHIRKNTYRCLKCSKTFSSLRSVASHMKTHPVKNVRERDPATHPHQCGQCGLRFKHVGNLANHVDRHTGPSHIWCSRCQRRFLAIRELTGHHCQPADQDQNISNPLQNVQAAFVPLQSIGKEECVEEQSSVLPDTNLSSESTSHAPSERQEQKEEISKHQTDDEEVSKKPAKRGRKRKKVWLTMKEVERPYKCAECPATFLHASYLKLHSQKHSGQKAFPCSQCEQSFASKAKLYTHQEKDHWGSTPIICQDCGKVFATARTLDEHRVLHTGERPYECQTCGEAFPYRQALTRHRRTHRPSYFQCSECGAEFHLKTQYKHHMDEHRAIRPHLCSHCGQSFSSLSMLKQHADKHGQKQFVCELCGKAFRKKGEHKMHLMTHQTVKPFPCPLCERSFVSRSKLQLHNSIAHLHLKPFSCQQCDAAFTSATYLKDHIRFAHTTERPFSCPLCLSCFAAKRFLKLHLKRTHKAKNNSTSTENEPSSTDVPEQSSA